jgi:hypothetical protein
MRRIHGLVPVAILLLAACGDDDGDDGDASSATTEAPATTATTEAAEEAPDEEAVEAVEVVAVDYAFEGLPGSIPAGTALRLRNDSDAEVHELIAVRLPADEQRSAEELVALPEEEMGALFTGPPDIALVAPPGEEGFPVLGDGTFAEAGRYLLLCNIPTGADPAAALQAMEEAAAAPEAGPPQIEGGPPHFTAGMFAELVVE